MTPLTLLLVPGVGMWPDLFGGLAAHLDAAGDLDHAGRLVEGGRRWRTEIVTRPTEPPGFDAQVGYLADRCRAAAPAVIVGVSGGATLGLAVATAPPNGLAAVVTHEPLVGPLEPELDRRVRVAAHELAAAPSETGAIEFLAGLYGPGWTAVPGRAHDWASGHHRVICREVGEFATFRPGPRDLAVELPHLTTVGSRSGPERHRVAALLATAGASAVVVPESGHLVLVDQPAAFAAAVVAFIAARLPTG